MNGIDVRKKKEEKITEIIIQLASEDWIEEVKLDKYIDDLREIYQHEYRHDYSIFFPLLSRIRNDGRNMSIATLNDNLRFLRKYVDKKYCEPVEGAYLDKEIRQIVKLLDHLNLESSRIEVITRNESQFEDLKIQLKNIKNESEIAQKQLEKATRKARAMQTELISILSVFSAVILVFFVDTQSITSAMISMQSTSIFRLILVLSICGLILFNGLFLLFQFISYIISKNSDDKVVMLKFVKPIIILNIVLVLLIVLDVACWYCCMLGIEPFSKLYYVPVK
ncbi:MAG: hypothetical protein IJ192_03660 [Clostridia bacterium]|nr:hypothetical protein [Clostridia bacterium]MBR2175331.1 hypothetical protein [Clostridia bacterium]